MDRIRSRVVRKYRHGEQIVGSAGGRVEEAVALGRNDHRSCSNDIHENNSHEGKSQSDRTWRDQFGLDASIIGGPARAEVRHVLVVVERRPRLDVCNTKKSRG